MKPRTSPETSSAPAATPARRTPRHGAIGTTPNSCRAEPPDPRWSWHHQTLLRLRDQLLMSHAEHARQALPPEGGRDIDPSDTARDEIDRDVLLAELRTEDDELFEVDSALQRIRDGTYGFCETTGQAIPPERLRAVPWTRYSIQAAGRLTPTIRPRC